MKDSDLLFNILTAAALGVVIILAPIGPWGARGRISSERFTEIESGTRVQLTLNERLGTGGERERTDAANAAKRHSDVDGRSELQSLK